MNDSSRWVGIAGVFVVVGTLGCVLERVGGHSRLAATECVESAPTLDIPVGTWLDVRLGCGVGASAHVGDAWRGVLRNDIPLGGGRLLPAGGTVEGIVSAVHPRSRRDLGGIDLRLIRLSAGDRQLPLHAASIRIDRLVSMDGGSTPEEPGVQPALESGSCLWFRVLPRPSSIHASRRFAPAVHRASPAATPLEIAAPTPDHPNPRVHPLPPRHGGLHA